MSRRNFELNESLASTFESYVDSIYQAQQTKILSVEEFLNNRIFIKNLYNNVVKFEAKKIQLKHQQIKNSHVKEGRKARFLLLKSRRMGFTTWEQALSYRACTSIENTTCATLADTKPNTMTIFRMVNLMARKDPNLPKGYFDSKSHIEFKSLNTLYHIGTAGARAFGRGDNLYRAHGSEVAFWPSNYDDTDTLIAGLTEAARHGEVTLETTANGTDGWFYEKYKEAQAGGNQWIPLFYPWFLDPENYIEPTEESKLEFMDTCTKEENNLLTLHHLTIGQMLWRRDKQLELKRLFPQEYPETWNEAFIVRGNTFFDLEMLAKISKNLKIPLNKRENLIIWKKPEPGRNYCAGADTSEGNSDSDQCVCGILDKETGEQVAVLRGRWRPEVFARKCVSLCKEYNGAMFACEINNHGHSVMNTVMNTLMYKNVYYRTKPLDKNKYGNSKVENVPGWNTNAKTRPILLDDLNEAMEEEFMVVNDPTFIEECKTFVDDGGRWEAKSGKKDDSIMAWGVAWQCRKQKKKTYIVV